MSVKTPQRAPLVAMLFSRAIAVSPAAQGVEVWPQSQRNLAVLADEEALPFAQALFDRVLAVHALEPGPRDDVDDATLRPITIQHATVSFANFNLLNCTHR